VAKMKRGMPKWTKAPPALVERFDELIASFPAAHKRTMFGYPVAFVAGQMCIGLFQDRMMMRLSEADRELLIREHGAVRFEPMPGRPMREYVEVPEKILRNPESIRDWASRSVRYASSLPPKSRRGGGGPSPAKKSG
jgi:TfoX/Sxy family transcriptional regulator of competence genes